MGETEGAVVTEEPQAKVEPTHPAALAIGAGALLNEEDKIALGKPERFRIKGAGGARSDLTKEFDVFPRPFHVLDKIGQVYLEIIRAADQFGTRADVSVPELIDEIMGLGGKQRDNLFKLVQLMLLRPPGEAIDWHLLDRDEFPDGFNCPKRDWLLYNMTSADVHKLWELFSKQNDWAGLLKKIMAVEGIGLRIQRAVLMDLRRASAARSSTSSEKPAGPTTTSDGSSDSPA